MVQELLTYFTIFTSVFAALSVIKLVFNFIKALLSNPPQKFELERGALIYYGVCLSYLITLLISPLL